MAGLLERFGLEGYVKRLLLRALQRLVDDERLKDRPLRERHPLAQDMPPSDLEGLRSYTFYLQCQCALLYDQVWYLSQPRWQRWAFAVIAYLEGRPDLFGPPIRQFYLPPVNHGD